MHPPLPSLSQLDHLSQALEDSGEDLYAILAVLIDDLTEAIPSFTGVSITIPAHGEPVTITAIEQPATAQSSMLLPLHLITTLPAGSALVFYAADPEAFQDLAADTRAAYGMDSNIVLDAHLPPPESPPGLYAAGILERSDLNQAIGVLIDHGYPPTQARDELAARARATHTTLHQTAHNLLHQLH